MGLFIEDFFKFLSLIFEFSSYTKRNFRHFDIFSFTFSKCQRETNNPLIRGEEIYNHYERKKFPQMFYRQLAEELLLKFDIKTSRSVICRSIKSKVEIMSLKMKNDAAKKRKQMLNKGRIEFEKLLDFHVKFF